MTRELVKGSIEVYPIKEYGAIEIGLHIFHNPGARSKGSKGWTICPHLAIYKRWLENIPRNKFTLNRYYSVHHK